MTVHLYLSMIPEALVASMLSPEEFGVYYAVGSKKKSHGQAIFFELDPDFRGDFFKIEEGIKRCKPHEDGSPKSSIYISVYRTLEHIPMSAILKLYLTTQDGRTLELSSSKDIPKSKEKLHLYQEIAPVSPLVVSALDPIKFYELIVEKPTMLLTLPAICFVDLRLDELAEDPEYGSVRDLPYKNIDHLRECLLDLKGKTILTKMVDRASSPNVPYRTIKTGVYVGNQKKLLFFPMPDREKLREDHYLWWRSANM